MQSDHQPTGETAKALINSLFLFLLFYCLATRNQTRDSAVAHKTRGSKRTMYVSNVRETARR